MGLPEQPVVSSRGAIPDRETKRARAGSHESPVECSGRNATSERRSTRRSSSFDQPLGPAWKLRVPGREAYQLPILSGGDRRAACQCAAKYIQFLEHLSFAVAMGDGIRRELRLQPYGKFDSAV